jgi:signal transduction histidine kinase
VIRDLLEALPEPALVVEDGRVTLANAAARAILGHEIEGDDIRALGHPAAVERLMTARPEAAEAAELVGLGEAERRWTMTVAPLPPRAHFVRLLDRSEAHAAEQMRVDFVANASHELRTPLATLVGYAETLRENADALDAETRERFTAVVHDEARRMQRLVEDLISLSRIEAERFSTPRDALALHALAEEARHSFADRPAARAGHGAPHRLRRGRGDTARASRPGHRALLPGRPEPKPVARRHRPRPLDRQACRRAASRPAQHRERSGQGDAGPRPPADRGRGRVMKMSCRRHDGVAGRGDKAPRQGGPGKA